ncbi:MAG: hypothetical protein ACXWVG_14005 [Telluria sp.]
MAHCLQCSALWSVHSSAQLSQTSAHIWHTAVANSLSRAMYDEAMRQICAQSMSSAMQRAIILTSFSRKHEAKQKSHASAQASHASMHAWCS